MSTPRLTFLVTEPGVEPRHVVTTDDVVKIGRLASAQLALSDPAASRMHAVIEVANASVTLIDLGSEPPTLVNGAAINKSALRPGDRIQIGQSVLLLESMGDGHARASNPVQIGAPAGMGESPPPAKAPAWNWGERGPAPRRERSAVGPALLVGVFLLVLVAFFLLR